MIDNKDFRKYAHQFVDWMADYLESKEEYAVKSMVRPGEIYDHLPEKPPQQSDSIDSIMDDFQNIIMPGMTHWQSPNFFAYFPANSSYPSILAEMLTATLGAQCMMWETSPAAAELEERVMKWLRQMINLPADFEGVIQDTASSATLCAILSAREKKSNFRINKKGFPPNKQFRVYCSTETHSSIEKAVKIAGIGKENLIKVNIDEGFRLKPEALEEAILKDISLGFAPLCVIATIGTTGSTAIDPLKKISEITSKYQVWLHVDAAMAGTALVLSEYQWMIEGIEKADSFVFNPHKWMFTNFDCSAYFVKDKETLIRTFEILPEYLKTCTRGAVNDYRDWGIALGRRFRALKLWFVIRDYGVTGIQKKIRHHISLAKNLAAQIESEEDFELMAQVPLNTVCFRFHPKKVENLNIINENLLDTLNKTGKLYLTHTKLNGQYTLRMVTSQTDVEERHVGKAWELIKELARKKTN